MKCKRCGNTVLPNQVFCNKCGEPVVEEEKKKFSLFSDDGECKEEKQKNPRFIIIISVIAALIVILIVVLLILRGGDNNKNNNTTTNEAVQTNGFMVAYENYNYRIPEGYSQSIYDNKLNIYNENNELIGAFSVRNTPFSKAIANKSQMVESKIKNTTDYKYSIMSQEQKNIGDVSSYVYKVKMIGAENGQSYTKYFYIALAEVDENNTAYIVSYITDDENTTYNYLENLVNIVKTAEKRTVNITNTDTSTNTTTNTVQNAVKTTNSVVTNVR